MKIGLSFVWSRLVWQAMHIISALIFRLSNLRFASQKVSWFAICEDFRYLLFAGIAAFPLSSRHRTLRKSHALEKNALSFYVTFIHNAPVIDAIYSVHFKSGKSSVVYEASSGKNKEI